MPWKCTREAPLESACQMILHTGKRDGANGDCEEILEEQIRPGTAPEDADDFIVTVLEEVIADGVKQ